MFVPAPYLASNGTAFWNESGYGSVGNGSTIAEAIGDLPSSPTHTYAHRSGIRLRENMQKGVIGFKEYINTPYESLAVRYRSEEGVAVWAREYEHHTWLPRYKAIQVKPWNLSYGGVGNGGIGLIHTQFQLGVLNRCSLTHHNVRERSIAEARLKLRDSRFDLSESLVGLSQTVSLVAQRSSQLLRAYAAARKGRWREVPQILGVSPRQIGSARNTAQAWLEYQFGWRPLMADIHSGMELVNYTLADSKDLATVTRRLSYPLPQYRTSLPNTVIPFSESLRGRSMAETKLVYRLSDAHKHWLVQMAADNPAYVAWVAMPFSFVVDWVAPVADWLQALTAPLGLEFESGYTTSKVEASWNSTFREASIHGYLYQEGIGARMGFDMVHIKRDVHHTWPDFYPYIRSPFTSNTRIASALALFVGLSPRR